MNLSSLTEVSPPPGFKLGETLSASKISKLKAFLKTQKGHQWIEPDASISRSTLNYGWHYADMEKNRFHFVELPPILKEIRALMVNALSKDLDPLLKAENFDNMIITTYENGQFLIPHYDADNCKNPLTERNFYFREPIIGLVIETDSISSFSFYYNEHGRRPSFEEEPIYKVNETPGATFLIDDESRHAPYFHGIPPVLKRRVSITIRQTIIPSLNIG